MCSLWISHKIGLKTFFPSSYPSGIRTFHSKAVVSVPLPPLRVIVVHHDSIISICSENVLICLRHYKQWLSLSWHKAQYFEYWSCAELQGISCTSTLPMACTPHPSGPEERSVAQARPPGMGERKAWPLPQLFLSPPAHSPDASRKWDQLVLKGEERRGGLCPLPLTEDIRCFLACLFTLKRARMWLPSSAIFPGNNTGSRDFKLAVGAEIALLC